MDEVSIWIYKKEQETKLKLANLSIKGALKYSINRARLAKRIGDFKRYWEEENKANDGIIKLLIDGKRNEDAAVYSEIMTRNKEKDMNRMITLETNQKNALLKIEERQFELEVKYTNDLQRYVDPTIAERNREKQSKINEALNAALRKDLDDYEAEKSRWSLDSTRDKALAKKREETKTNALIKDVPVDSPMEIYMKNKIKADTANEMNESTKSTYQHDLVYLFFKVLLFVVLGIVFYFLMKDQNPTELITQAKETTRVLSDKVSDGVKTIKETVKEKGANMIKEIKSKSPELK